MQEPIIITKKQARQFILVKHGLLGTYRFKGKQGAYDFVCQSGCIQFDPVDSCGKNAELTLQSRVKGFTKKTLYKLLYEDRLLIDYPDKNISIMPVKDWPYFERYRAAAKENGKCFEGLTALEKAAMDYIGEHGAVCSDSLPITGDIFWHSAIHWSGNWSGTTHAARAVLEQLYSTGELIIHHKKGARKFYAPAVDYLPKEVWKGKDPFPEERDHIKWRVLRRVGAVGLLWNRASDALLNIWGMKTLQRNSAFEQLTEEGSLQCVRVEGIREPLYFKSEDLCIMKEVLAGTPYKPRCEFLAPLDCMLWDRNLVEALFDFEYRWEIYTPAEKRKYGYYVLPILYGDRFAGRIEAVASARKKVLTVKNIWYEPGFQRTMKFEEALKSCISRLAGFNECDEIEFLTTPDSGAL